MAQLGTGHFISTVVKSMFTWRDQLPICGLLTPGLQSCFHSVRLAHIEIRHEQNHYHFDEFYFLNVLVSKYYDYFAGRE